MNEQDIFTDELETTIKQAFLKEITERPPTIGLIGVSGVGKSSTINSMFRTDLEISHVKACTKEFKEIELKVEIKEGQAQGSEALLRVIDAPGLGEDLDLDPKYLEMYRQNLVKCDIILWVITARNRAIALDQMYLKQLPEFTDKIVFGINQLDLVEPINWNKKLNLPSEEQELNIKTITDDRKEKLEKCLGREIVIIPYSANTKYNLQSLFTALIEACPKERAWIYSSIKAFDAFDFLPADVRDRVIKAVQQKETKSTDIKKNHWFNFFK
jgi:uncharacterized protein